MVLLNQIAQNLNLNAISSAADGTQVTGGCASDLLSDVLAKAKNGTLWVTNQKHQNIIGVASMLNLAGVIIAGGIDPDEQTIAKSTEESVALYTTHQTVFEVVGKLYEMGIRSC